MQGYKRIFRLFAAKFSFHSQQKAASPGGHRPAWAFRLQLCAALVAEQRVVRDRCAALGAGLGLVVLGLCLGGLCGCVSRHIVGGLFRLLESRLNDGIRLERGFQVGELLLDVGDHLDALKNKEKGRTTLADELDTVPATLPALMRAQKLQKRAARFGCGPEDAAGAARTLDSARAAWDAQQTAENAGELLLAAADAMRLAGVDAEEALTFAAKRFTQRLEADET